MAFLTKNTFLHLRVECLYLDILIFVMEIICGLPVERLTVCPLYLLF